MNKIFTSLDSDQFHQLILLENYWNTSLKITEKELLNIFPELQTDIIPTKMDELAEGRIDITNEIKKTLQYYNLRFPKDFWFLRIWIKNTLVKELLLLEKQIGYFEHLKFLASHKKISFDFSDKSRKEALLYPIQNIISNQTKIRKSGRNLIATCPLHQEKTPSFYIYLNTNSFYCFGCNHGGDSITLVKKMLNLSFPEAIKYLLNQS